VRHDYYAENMLPGYDKRKMYDFYGVALSSVEVALKLRAVGSIAPFFSGDYAFTKKEAIFLFLPLDKQMFL